MGSDFLRELSERLTIIRGQMSQAAFAPVLGVHKNTVGIYERAESEIGAESVANLVKLGWNANWLLTGEGPERLKAPSDAAAGVREPGGEYQSHSLTLNREILARSSRIIGMAIDMAKVEVGPSLHSELIADVYETLMETEVGPDQLITITQQLRAKLLEIQGRNDEQRTGTPDSSTGGRDTIKTKSG